MRWLILFLAWLPLTAVNAKVFCYYLVDPEGNVTSYSEPPWDLSYPPRPLTTEERLKREKLGHLVITLVDGGCQTTGKKIDEISLADLEKKDQPPPKATEAPTESVSVDIPLAPAKDPAHKEAARKAESAPPAEPELPADSHEVKTFSGHGHAVLSVDMEGVKAVSVDEGGTVSVWDARSGHNVRNSSGIAVNTLRVGNGKILVGLNSMTDNLQVWDLQSGSPIHTLKGHEGRILDLAMADTYLASASLDNSVRLWNYNSGEMVLTLATNNDEGGLLDDPDEGVQAVALNPGRVAGARGKRIFLWSIADGKQIRTWEGPEKITALAFGGNGKLAGSTAGGNDILVWDSESGKVLHTLSGHQQPVRDLAAKDKYLVSAGEDHTLKIWDLDSGTLQNTLEGHQDKVLAVAIQGGHIVSGSQDKSVRLWMNHLKTIATDKPAADTAATDTATTDAAATDAAATDAAATDAAETTDSKPEAAPAAGDSAPPATVTEPEASGAGSALEIVQQALQKKAVDAQKRLTGFSGVWALDVQGSEAYSKLSAEQVEAARKLRGELMIQINESEVVYVRGDIKTAYPYTLEDATAEAVILSTQHEGKPATITLTQVGDASLNLKTSATASLDGFVWSKYDPAAEQEKAAAKALPQAFLGQWRVDLERTVEYAKNGPNHDPAAPDKMLPVFKQLMAALKLKFTDKNLIYVRTDKENSYPYSLKEVSDTSAKLTTEQGGKTIDVTLTLVDGAYLNFRVSATEDLNYYIWKKE